MFSSAYANFRDLFKFQIICGILPFAVGLAVLLGWHTGHTGFAAALGQKSPLQYLSAVSFLLCFAGIVFFTLRSNTGLLLAASVIVSLGAFDLYENLIGLPFDAPSVLGFEQVARSQFHSTSIGAVSFLFIGLAWIISRFRWKYGQIVCGSMGSFAFACGLGTLIGFAAGYPEILRWGHSSELSVYAGFAFAVTGAIIIFENRKISEGFLGWSHYIPVGILVTGLTVSFCVRQALHSQEIKSIDRTVALKLAGLTHTFESEMARRIRANERMAERWGGRETIERASWERDAWSYYHDFKTYQSLEFIGADHEVQWSVPIPTDESSADRHKFNEKNREAVLEDSRYQRKTTVSGALPLINGGTGILAYSPIFDGDEFKGFILGVFSVDKFFELTIPKSVRDDYSIDVVDNGSLIYSTGETIAGRDLNVDQSETADFGRAPYIVRISPSQNHLNELSSRIEDLALVLGTLISILFSWSVLLALRARRHNRVTETANKLLKSEIEGRKEIESKLRETSTFREALLNGANYIIISTDQNGLITSFNRTAENLLGYTSEEVVGKFTLDHFHDPSEISKYGEELSRTFEYKPLSGLEPLVIRARSNIADEHEWSYFCKDGSTFPVTLSVTAVVEEHGKVTGFLGIARDNSQLQMASRLLVESEGRFKAFVNNTPALTYIKDKFGRYRFVNTNFEKLFKVTQGAMIGKSDFALTDKSSASKVLEIEKRVLATGVPEESVEIVPLSDGRSAHFLFVRFVLPIAGGEDGLGVIAIDLSAQKAIEEELRVANFAAVESSRLKSEFLANLSHEIRTPMNGVLGMLEVLLDTSLEASQREYAKVAQNSARSLMIILDDILDFSKLEAGQLTFETIEFDLRSTVENTITSFAETCEAKGIEMTSFIGSDVPTGLLGDPGRVKQVLTNLIGNGVKFTECGEVTLRISKAAEYDDRISLRFEVSDTGIGIAEEAQKTLFNAFVQEDGSMVRKYGGTGLGLSISKHLVEMMNGEIQVESSPGRGSTFRFTGVFGVQKSVKPHIPIMDLSGVKVLIADDHEANRESISTQLQGLGMITVSVPDGESCIKELISHAEVQEPFDIVMLDYEMPGLNGFETAEFIKQKPGISDVKIVLMPSFGQRGHAQTAVEKGISGYLIKPVRQVELFDCVSTILGGGKTETGGPDQSQLTGTLVTRHSMLENRMEDDAPVLLVSNDVKNQNLIGTQLESLGYRSEIVSDSAGAFEALSKRTYSLIFVELAHRSEFVFADPVGIREALDTKVPVIGISPDPSKEERRRALEAGMSEYLSLPFSEERLRNTIEEFVGGNTNGAVIHPPVEKETSPDAPKEMGIYLRQLTEDVGPEMVALTVSLFAEDTARHINLMTKAIAAENLAQVGELAVSLGPVCEDVCASGMREICRLLEEESRKGELETVIELAEQLKTGFEATLVQLRDFELAPTAA